MASIKSDPTAPLQRKPVAFQVIEAVMLTSGGKGRFSSHILAEAVLLFFETAKLFPAGICRDMECVAKWALKVGRTLQRLAAQLNECEIDLQMSLTKI